MSHQARAVVLRQATTRRLMIAAGSVLLVAAAWLVQAHLASVI